MSRKKSRFIKEIIVDYKRTFPNQWIEDVEWSDESEQKSYSVCKKRIDDFINRTILAFSKSILSGDFLLRSMNELDSLALLCQDEIFFDNVSVLKHKIQQLFLQVNNNIIDFSNQYKLEINSLEKKISINPDDLIINAFSKRTEKYSAGFQVLEIVLDICFREYQFSYNREYVQELVLKRDMLGKIKKQVHDAELSKIITVVWDKITFLLIKLSYHSKNREVKFRLDFEEQSVDFDANETHGGHYLHHIYYNSPRSIPTSTIQYWQASCLNKTAGIWQMVLLMRYYTKVTCSMQQIQKLIILFNKLESHILRYSKNTFNNYALKTTKNYMYNCQLAFLLKTKKDLNYNTFKEQVDAIIEIQKETGICNYYPYLKAAEWLNNHIDQSISECNLDVIQDYKHYFSKILHHLEAAYKWCYENQYQPFQLCYSECIEKSNLISTAIFTPSTFSRPVKYDDINKQIQFYQQRLNSIVSQFLIHKEHQEILILKNQIEKNRKTYIEVLGIFTAVITFLIGSLTIFLDARGDILTFQQKIENIILLGLVLLLFINGGYFLTSEINWKSFRHWFFVITSLLYFLILAKAYF